MFKFYKKILLTNIYLGESLSWNTSDNTNPKEQNNNLDFLSLDDKKLVDDLNSKLDTVLLSSKFIGSQESILSNWLLKVWDPKDKEYKEIYAKIQYLNEQLKKYWEEATLIRWQLKSVLDSYKPSSNLENINTNENIDLKNISPIEFFNLDNSQRLKYISNPWVEQTSVINQEVKDIKFTFTFNWEFNEELYLWTTAWSVLPAEVWNVVLWGEEFSRTWVSWEFFNKSWERLIIKEWTHIQIWELRDEALLENLKTLNNNKVTEFLQENPWVNENIVIEAVNRWIDINFALKSFSWLGKDKWAIENAFIEIDRFRWSQNMSLDLVNWKYLPELAFYILAKFNPNWQEIAQDLWYEKQTIDNHISDWSLNLSLKSWDIINGDSLESWDYLKWNELLQNQEFMNKLNQVAINIWANVDDLIKIMRAESSLDPRIMNSQTKATWLIQFMPNTARDLWTTIWKIRWMTALEQLDLVERYFLKNSRGYNLDSITKLYQVVFFPASLWKDQSWVFDAKDAPWYKVAAQNPWISKFSDRSDWLIDGYTFEKYVLNHVSKLW